MATSAVLEDTITCCICFNVYCNPHTLPCLHTLCKPCIDQLVVRGKVECPECRETTDVNKIRKDFRIQNLIDDQKNTGGAKEQTSTVCGMCNDKDKGIVSHCQDCEHYMCAGCEKGHKGMKVCRGHTVKPVKDIIKAAQSKLEEGVAQWKKEKAVIADKASKIKDYIKSIHNQREQQIEKTGKHFDKLIADLEKKRASLIHDIREQNEVTIKNFRKTKVVYDQLTVEIDTKLQILTEIINKKDITILNDVGNDMDSSLQAEINSIRDRVSCFFTENLSPIELVTDDAKRMDPGIRIQQLLLGTNLLQGASSNYTKLATNKYKQDKVKTLGGIQNIFRVKVISNNLWCAAYIDGIQIYNKNLDFIRAIKNANYSCVTGISEWGEQVLVSCSDGQGLHLIEQSGKYLHEIAGGDFTDVCSSDKKVFAFDRKRKQIIVYESKNSQWNEKKSIAVQDGSAFYSKFIVSCEKILISLPNYELNQIRQYNLQGDLELTCGTEGSQAGELNCPILCSADKSGNFLVADSVNNRLQVYLSRQQTWHIVNLQSECTLSEPFDAVVDGNCDNIWVVTKDLGNDQQLLLRFCRKL